MSDAIKTFIAIDAGISRDVVEQSFPPDGSVDLVGIVEGLDEAWLTLQEVPCDLLVIACVGHSEKVLVLIDGAVKQRPTRPVIILGYGSPNGFVSRVFEAGADDVLVLPQDPEGIRFALQKALARKAGVASAASSIGQAEVICILGPKGGTGKTLTATSLAVALAESGKRVALVDLDLQFGDVGLCMGLAPETTIYDLVRTGGSLDEEKMGDFLVTHHSGVEVLIAPSRPDHAASISVDFLRDVYRVLRGMFDYVIVDTPPGFTPEVIATIDLATQICMVGMLDALSLKNTKLGLETLELMGIPRERIKLVLNRARTRVGISDEDVEAIIDRTPDVLVPSDRDISRSVNEGNPIVTYKPQSEAAEAFRRLANSYVAVAPAERASRLRRFVGRGN
jgi:pilus assembly protein CpaE